MKGMTEAIIEIDGKQVLIYYPQSMYWSEIENYFENHMWDDD